mmetsp:Transcript_70272/g.131417  ORF Transcript_70272/g.131417 Transcript_70272/m.131417 type:complete len:310 (+) Transcript_70272:136-1065(+)
MTSQQAPDGCQLILLSPLQIHFSQTRIRSEFQDGRMINDTLAEITGVLWEPQGSLSDPVGEAVGEAVQVGEAAVQGEKCDAFASASSSPLLATHDGTEPKEQADARRIVLLRGPFPCIEVTKWRCKLREADGAPKLDPKTGLELYSHEVRWFSFDNRRLYCLQRAAAALWPTEVRCEVVEVPGTLARTRELRKFDTRTFGCNVVVGRRDDKDAVPWSWRLAVGLPEEEQPEEGVARPPSMRWRGARGGASSMTTRRRAKKSDANEQDDDEEESSRGSECARNTLLFVMVYLLLRVALSICKHSFNVGTG